MPTLEFHAFEEGILWRIADWTTGRILFTGNAWTYDQAHEQIEEATHMIPAPKPRNFWEDGAEPWPVEPEDDVVILGRRDLPMEGAKVRSTRPGERCELVRNGRVMRGFLD